MMAKKGPVPWAVMNGRTWQLECQRCGATEQVESPIGVSDLWRQAEAFEDRHRECEEKKEDSRGDIRTDTDDVLYERVVRLVLTEQRCSVSMLQRWLGIGYARASCLINRMVSEGLIGKYDPLRGYRQRVLMTLEEWEAKKR